MPQHRRTMKQAAYGAAAGLTLFLTLGAAATASAATTTTTYPSSSTSIPNPERGFFIQHSRCEAQPFDATRLKRYRADKGITLARCVLYLPKTPDIGPQIAELDAQAERLRAGGAKMILRFAYTDTADVSDADPAMVQSHLDQLTASLRRNSDVIAVMESGFVGRYGEGHYSEHFGTPPNVSDTNWADRNAVVAKLLRILPPDRKVVVRTPKMKWQQFGSVPATQQEFNTRADRARVGHVNDCFLFDETDQGTYAADAELRAKEYAYLQSDTRYVPMGGETCGVKPEEPARPQCPTARQEMALFHYTYLSSEWHPTVLGGWESGGCMEEIRQRMGYRFSLVSTTSVSSVTRGTAMPFSMRLFNHGWANPVSSRPVRLVLRPRFAAPKPLYTFGLTDARGWGAQAGREVVRQVQIPATMPAGAYDMLLSFPDSSPKLAAKPAYAIQLANAGIWEPSTGLNSLNRIVTLQ